MTVVTVSQFTSSTLATLHHVQLPNQTLQGTPVLRIHHSIVRLHNCHLPVRRQQFTKRLKATFSPAAVGWLIWIDKVPSCTSRSVIPSTATCGKNCQIGQINKENAKDCRKSELYPQRQEAESRLNILTKPYTNLTDMIKINFDTPLVSMRSAFSRSTPSSFILVSITDSLQTGRITKYPIFNIGRYLNYSCVKIT